MESLIFNAKEFEIFIRDISMINNRLEEKIRISNPDFRLDFEWTNIEVVENYFKNIDKFNMGDIEEFWAYVGECLRYYVGGEWILASKSEDVAFTPIIINYGFKGKWKVRLSPEVWRKKMLLNELSKKTLLKHIESINNKYGK